jgi:thiol-disulfide isomerase/thioredoxin
MIIQIKKLALFSLLYFLSGNLILGQNIIGIGEKVPDIEFGQLQLINTKSKSIRLSQFKGKLIILDFWSFNCANCIEAFPKMEFLQKKFAGKIQILLVNRESKKRTIEFFEKMIKKFKRPDLIFVTNDTVLDRMFPKYYVPWEIWIDENLRLRHVTEESDVTEEKISNFIDTGEFDGIELVPHPDYKQYKPLFEQPNKEYLKSIQFYSYISKYEDGLSIGPQGFYLYEPGKMRLVRDCKSIEELLVTAFSEDFTLYDFVQNNVCLEVSDTLKFRRPENNHNLVNIWIRNFAYNYDCGIPESKKARVYEIMRQDLVNFFNVDVNIEKRETKCLVLIRIGKENKIVSKGLNKPLPMDTLYSRYNCPFKDFVKDIRYIFRDYSVPYPLIDETGYTGTIDIVGLNLSGIKKNEIMTTFRSELQKYGLDLIEKDCMQDVLVIKDKK